MKAFLLNESDVVAAETLEEAITWYCELTGLSRDEAIDEPHEIDIQKERIYTCENPEEECDCELITIAQEIENHKHHLNEFPCMIAERWG